jgi:hypothetical protein
MRTQSRLLIFAVLSSAVAAACADDLDDWSARWNKQKSAVMATMCESADRGGVNYLLVLPQSSHRSEGGVYFEIRQGKAWAIAGVRTLVSGDLEVVDATGGVATRQELRRVVDWMAQEGRFTLRNPTSLRALVARTEGAPSECGR